MTFNADVSDGMNWRFLPTQRAVKVPSAPVLRSPHVAACFTFRRDWGRCICSEAGWGHAYIGRHLQNDIDTGASWHPGCTIW